MSVALTITLKSDAGLALQRLSNSLANRAPLHAAIADKEETFFRDYVGRLDRHNTARGLGATPSAHYERAAARIEGKSDADAAKIVIPNDTGLGRAFRDFNITPKNGKKFLTIPAHRTTYNVPARLVPHSMTFSLIGGRHKAFIFTSGPDVGSVAYWLREKVTIKRDASLLPGRESIEQIAIGAARSYLMAEMKGGPA